MLPLLTFRGRLTNILATTKVGTSAPDLSTPSSTTKQTIRLLYGQGVAKDLLTAEAEAPRKGKRKRDADGDQPKGGTSSGDGSWTAQAHFTNANYHSKKFVFLLFINSEEFFIHCSSGRFKVSCRSSGGVLKDQKGIRSLLHRYSSKRHFAIHLSQASTLPLLWNSGGGRYGYAAYNWIQQQLTSTYILPNAKFTF